MIELTIPEFSRTVRQQYPLEQQNLLKTFFQKQPYHVIKSFIEYDFKEKTEILDEGSRPLLSQSLDLNQELVGILLERYTKEDNDGFVDATDLLIDKYNHYHDQPYQVQEYVVPIPPRVNHEFNALKNIMRAIIYDRNYWEPISRSREAVLVDWMTRPHQEFFNLIINSSNSPALFYLVLTYPVF